MIIPKRTFFLFSLCVLFLMPMLMSFGSSAVTETQFWNDRVPIDGANLQVSVGATPGIRQRIGARNLVDFIPRGSVQQGNFTKFSATATFEFSLDFYSFYSTVECFPNAQMSMVSNKYLGVTLCTSPTDRATWKSPVDYSVTYSNYALGALAATGFDGVVSLGASVISLTPSVLDFGNDDFILTTKEFVGTVRRAEVKSSAYSEIAPYTTFYNAETPEIKVTTMEVGRDKPSTGAVVVNSLDTLGMSVLQTQTISAQQASHDIPQQGSDVLGGFHLTLKPEVTYSRQQMQLTSRNNVLIDTVKNLWDVRYGLIEDKSDPIATDSNIYRTIGWQVKNNLGALVVRVDCDIYALVEIDPVKTNTTLGDPNVGLGDFWFDNKTGGTGGKIPLSESIGTQLWGQYGIWIILGGLGVVFILLLIYTPLGPLLVRVTLNSFNRKSKSDR